MSCEVCGAPPVPDTATCAFCRSPLEAPAETGRLLEYLAGRLPASCVRVRRRGLLRRGPVEELRVRAAAAQYRGRLRHGRLQLDPEAPAAEWVDRLLADLSRQAATDGALRSAMTRSGWALR